MEDDSNSNSNSNSDSESESEPIATYELTDLTEDYLTRINREYKKVLSEQTKLNEMIKLGKLTPSKIRTTNYDSNYRLFEKKEEDINDENYSLDIAIKNLAEGKNKLNEITKIIQNMKQNMNDARSGATLQELSRESISKYKIKPEPNNIAGNFVLEQPYNENKGGRKRKTNKKKMYKKRRITNKKKY